MMKKKIIKNNDNWYFKFQEKERTNEKKCNKQQNRALTKFTWSLILN